MFSRHFTAESGSTSSGPECSRNISAVIMALSSGSLSILPSRGKKPRQCIRRQLVPTPDNRSTVRCRTRLTAHSLRTLDLDRDPDRFEGSLDLLGPAPGYTLNDVLRRALDEILRFFQPEARDESNLP